MTRALLISLSVLGACVTSPSDTGQVHSRRDPIDFDGTAANRLASLRIEAWDHSHGSWELIRTFSGTANLVAADPDAWGWRTLGVALADRHWVLPGAGCQGSGMARLRVLELRDTQWTQLPTYTPAGEACMWSEIAGGAHPVAAGSDCSTGDQIVLFAPPQCVPAATTDATPPLVTLRVTDGFSAWQTTSAPGAHSLSASLASLARPLTISALARDANGGAAQAYLGGGLTVECMGTTPTTRFIEDLRDSRSQPIVPGALVQIGVDDSFSVDLVHETSSCPAGTRPRVSLDLVAGGINAAGTRAETQIMYLSLP